ncbi:GTPase domain-containing protein [Phanerochaete sordida]|uniref:GTPase domain-containing protein n=1 Tax=Phanerochaete sordida TaxID=48140 RepID=A0A9P3GBY8_9APHY|nr:GTPase domain-containing protein [Phanerochaete sordida]
MAGLRFRLLIIGKTGCGKTTILSKACGEDEAGKGSESRGVHNIEKALRFKNNDLLLVHDSEGFEAGVTKEFAVVNAFIERRATLEDVSERLHMVWYCVEANSRPLQHAEKEFFSSKRPVPVVVLITKFDMLIQDILQELEGEEENEGLDDDELEEKAAQIAIECFDENYRKPLEALQFPPYAIVTLSDTHKSKPDDSRLHELIKQTVAALKSANDADATTQKREEQRMLGDLFVMAQTADLAAKVELTVIRCMGTGYGSLGMRLIDKKEMIDSWNTCWSSWKGDDSFTWLSKLLQKHVDLSPRLIGHDASPDRLQVQRWTRQLEMAARLEQTVLDSVMIMKHIVLLDAEHIGERAVVERLARWYDGPCKTAVQVRALLMDRHNRNPHATTGLDPEGLYAIIRDLKTEVPDIDLSVGDDGADASQRKGFQAKFGGLGIKGLFKKKDK